MVKPRKKANKTREAVQQAVVQMAAQPIAQSGLKIDFGCGPNKRPGFTGVDSRAFPGVDVVLDLVERVSPTMYKPWPWADGSVAEVFSSHFIEHLTGPQRVWFFNELYRVMRVGGTGLVITPYWSHASAYGDPTHQWPPMSEWMSFYLNRQWRDMNAPHTDYTCDFDTTFGGSWDGWLEARNAEHKSFAMNKYTNSWRDLHITIAKNR